MHEPVPQELVDMIIDGVGGGCARVYRPPLRGARDLSNAIASETLKSCALVARSWTRRSYMNLFREIILYVGEEEGIHDLVLPSAASLQFVEFLEIYVALANPNRSRITLHLLTEFSASPVEFLQIDGGLFSLSGRPEIRACFEALSRRLLGITFRFCLFDPEPLRDILCIRDTSANILFLSCDQEHPDDPARKDVDWELVYYAQYRKLCVMGTEEKPSEEFFVDLSELSVKFFRLEVDFYEDGKLADATQRLIDANGEATLFLKLDVISISFTDAPDDLEALPPPSLALCTNLMELVLNMKGSYSCVVEIPGTIFASLLEANCPNLFKITLEIEASSSLFLAESRTECLDSWKDLDSTLTMLAERLMDRRGKKLVFVMEVTCEDDTLHRAKKWLPRLLPMFHEEGELHVHDGEDDVCRGRRYNAEDKRSCMGRTVLAKYGYESESDEKIEEVGATAGGRVNEENQGGGGAEGREEDGEADKGNEGDDEGEEEDK